MALITGPSGSSVIPANATNLESLEKQLKAFLQDPKAGELKLYLLGNPIFSLVFGGGATALALLVGVSMIVGMISDSRMGEVMRSPVIERVVEADQFTNHRVVFGIGVAALHLVGAAPSDQKSSRLLLRV